MDMKTIRTKAKKLGVKTSKKRKPEIIKEIQRAEGNFDCFGSAANFCDQTSCSWRKECLK